LIDGEAKKENRSEQHEKDPAGQGHDDIILADRIFRGRHPVVEHRPVFAGRTL
jgi:hypothetical protein